VYAIINSTIAVGVGVVHSGWFNTNRELTAPSLRFVACIVILSIVCTATVAVAVNSHI